MQKIAEGVSDIFHGLKEDIKRKTAKPPEQPQIQIRGEDGRWHSNQSESRFPFDLENHFSQRDNMSQRMGTEWDSLSGGHHHPNPIHNRDGSHNHPQSHRGAGSQSHHTSSSIPVLGMHRENTPFGHGIHSQFDQPPVAPPGGYHHYGHQNRGDGMMQRGHDMYNTGFPSGHPGIGRSPGGMHPGDQQHGSSSNPASSIQMVSSGDFSRQPQQEVRQQHDDPYELHSTLMIYSGSLSRWCVGWVSERTDDVLKIRFYADYSKMKEGDLKEKTQNAKNSTIIRKEIKPELVQMTVEELLPPNFSAVPSQSRPGEFSYVDSTTGTRYASLDLAWTYFLSREVEENYERRIIEMNEAQNIAPPQQGLQHKSIPGGQILVGSSVHPSSPLQSGPGLQPMQFTFGEGGPVVNNVGSNWGPPSFDSNRPRGPGTIPRSASYTMDETGQQVQHVGLPNFSAHNSAATNLPPGGNPMHGNNYNANNLDHKSTNTSKDDGQGLVVGPSGKTVFPDKKAMTETDYLMQGLPSFNNEKISGQEAYLNSMKRGDVGEMTGKGGAVSSSTPPMSGGFGGASHGVSSSQPKTHKDIFINEIEKDLAGERLLKKSMEKAVKKQTALQASDWQANPFHGFPSANQDSDHDPQLGMPRMPVELPASLRNQLQAEQEKHQIASTLPVMPKMGDIDAGLVPLPRCNNLAGNPAGLPSFAGPSSPSNPMKHQGPSAYNFPGMSNLSITSKGELPDFAALSNKAKANQMSSESSPGGLMNVFGSQNMAGMAIVAQKAMRPGDEIPCPYQPDIAYGDYRGPEVLVALAPI